MATATKQDTACPPKAAAGGGLAEWEIDRDFLFETIICDVHSCAMQVATLTIMLSACARPEGAAGLRSGRHLLHDDSSIMALALRYGEDLGLTPAAVKRVEGLYRSVGEAKRTLGPLMRSNLQREALSSCTQTWRRLAVGAAEALAVLDAPTKSRLNSVYTEDATTLRQFLKEAAEGDLSRVDAMGSIQPPFLRQRRRNPRVAVQRSCMLVLPSGSYRAEIADISQEGLGIVCSQPMEDQQTLHVALDDGRQLEAKVMRRQGNRVGLKLRTPLSATDPLFRPSDEAPRR